MTEKVTHNISPLYSSIMVHFDSFYFQIVQYCLKLGNSFWPYEYAMRSIFLGAFAYLTTSFLTRVPLRDLGWVLADFKL